MNFFEAMEALRQGKKVRHKSWNIGSFLFKELGDTLINENINHVSSIHICKAESLSKDSWELFEEPKPKVKRWKWRTRTSDGWSNYPRDNYDWLTEQQAKNRFQEKLIGPWAGPEEFDE